MFNSSMLLSKTHVAYLGIGFYLLCEGFIGSYGAFDRVTCRTVFAFFLWGGVGLYYIGVSGLSPDGF